ncbi:MAG TPA: PoNe immunity protein domain-containing protein, partial [Paraburkholderia sp.]|uniref:PoNe immunity protein domain-containing protein n=1 Tax=Paraburkholderia sp. TaxID=1926495 RepID=UPI002D08F273
MDFSKQRRQKYLTEKEYSGTKGAYERGIQKSAEALTSGRPMAPTGPSNLRWSIARHYLELLLLNYTAGQPIEELREQFPEVIKRFDVFIENDISKPNDPDTLEITQIDAYVYVFWLLALCKL